VAFYLASNPDVAEAGVNPLLHYLESGRAEGRAPRHRAGAREQAVQALVGPHLDVDYYLHSEPQLDRAGGDALTHFLEWGWREGRNPSPAFDVAFYLGAKPDVAAAGVNPRCTT
jgi:hypothetical protein